MQPDDMLGVLDTQGADAGSDFNDADDVTGWFGWSVSTDEDGHTVLEVTYRPDGDDDTVPTDTAKWRLVPLPA